MHAVGVDNEEVFQAFDRVLRKTEEMCMPPTFKKWEDAIRERGFVVAEKALICTASFRTQFFDVATRVDALTSRFVHYRGSLWALASDIPLELCQTFLDEFFRRESLGLERLDADTFFQRSASFSSASGVSSFVK